MLNIRVTMSLCNSSTVYPIKIKTCVHTKTYSCIIHSCIIYNSPEGGITLTHINGRTEKQKIVYSCNRILFSHEKGWRTDICYLRAQGAAPW